MSFTAFGKSLTAATVMVTHDPEEAMLLADRIPTAWGDFACRVYESVLDGAAHGM